ncbi:uncharacterized protein LOC133046082 isoform X1 [Dama dama]|uniref:uncharacterized protein LOC133046082 isoform X1 n=1 Tax=Dama dama TaxID=30532 RepID=UPI002A35FF0C|nr:uncharacterized protein LOC133046082 isoform X1 [Dama dama]XP_060984927.1 uncharacterized protein LOC133046082 isoform X1 [Dama dama]XP_060984928.1 uncharacterized protein LOC133046082 isoform X1 [Dama dama]XP_060984929.1 uncharacterized protein LOC133046082 isoform X1 [Dama dama]XP_060984930.1 uncharacterized protein LOC133046082 isoform X1 [Dama dama]XP_060984931.1 uncharacterized protein LOC133046082 isoform X1 [Dama dama]XP_060984932.1 uncharacterized protein LOC133046082 isoform X1 [D
MSLPVLPGDSTPGQTDTHQLSNGVDESPLEETVAQLTAASPTSRRLVSPPGTDRAVSAVRSRNFSFTSPAVSGTVQTVSPQGQGPHASRASARPRCFLGPGTQEVLRKCSTKGHMASPSMAKTQQVSALGAWRLTWCGSRVTGPNGCDGRNSASAATPCGLGVLTFWASDLSGPSWQKERGTRTQVCGKDRTTPTSFQGRS